MHNAGLSRVLRCIAVVCLIQSFAQQRPNDAGGSVSGRTDLSMREQLGRLARSAGFCKVLLVCCALIWGSSFFLMKDVMDLVPPFWLLAIRFTMAVALMLVVFWKQFSSHLDRRTISVGLVIGFLECAGYAVQTLGLTLTTPGKNAFLTGTYCVMVPFCAWLLGMGRPKRYDVVAAFVCLAGLGLVALDNGFPLNAGDLLTLLGAVFYALQLVVVAKEGQELDVWAITAWQFIVMALASLVCGLVWEQPPAISTLLEPNVFWPFVYFGVVCSFFCLTVLNYAFTKVDPTEGGILSSLESPSGVLFSVLAGREVLTGRLVSGFALIFLAVLISNAYPAWQERWQARKARR